MGLGAVPLAFLSAGLGTAGSLMTMSGNMSAAGYQSAVAERNAALAEENARREMEAAQSEGADLGYLARDEIGQIIAAHSGSGALAGLGSSGAVINSARSLAARDQLRLRRQGDAAVAARRQEAADFRSDARMAQYQRRQSLYSGLLGIGTSLVGGAQSVAQARMPL